MSKLIFLGTANSISDEEHENTHMILVGKERSILIDCVNSPILRIQHAGVDINDVTDLIATHFHPDHISGVPQLLLNMWLMGRKRPITIYGLAYTLDRIEEMMELYGWTEWPGFYKVTFKQVEAKELATVLENEDFRILSTPVQHFIPTIGLRIEFRKTGKVVAYSCDTEPCAQVVRLAAGADLLIHEASGALPGHSSAGQAGEAASKAEVGALYLIHYPTGQYATGDICAEARRTFHGPVTQAEDYMTLEFT